MSKNDKVLFTIVILIGFFWSFIELVDSEPADALILFTVTVALKSLYDRGTKYEY